MNETKRMHPLAIVQSVFKMIGSNAIFLIYLFIIQSGEVSTFITYARIAFLVLIGAHFFSMIIRWFQTTYVFSEKSIHQYKGLFKKTHQRMQVEEIENIERHTPVYFKPFGVTSLILHTRSTDSSASVTFAALRNKEALRIEHFIERVRGEETIEIKIEDDHQAETKEDHPNGQTMTLQFQATWKDLLKASFLSMSFFIIIPVLLTIYEHTKSVLPLETYANQVLDVVTQSWVMITVSLVLLLIFSMIIGIVNTWLKYGKYEIASDDERVYIRSGLFVEKHVSMRKKNVQAVRIHQTPIKKWLNMSEVMLISTTVEEENLIGVYSLFPFLSKQRSYRLAEQLIPGFHVYQQLKSLPKQALFMKMIRVPWLFIIATALILLWKPNWLWLVPVLFAGTYVNRYFDYRNSAYLLADDRIEFRSGGLWTSSFQTSRKQLIEITVKQSFVQQKLGLATIETTNMSSPVYRQEVADIPMRDAEEFTKWYGRRIVEHGVYDLG